MGRSFRSLVVAVVVIFLVLPGPAQVTLSERPLVERQGPITTDTGPGSRFLNQVSTNTTGTPSYFASMVSIGGIGSFTNNSDHLKPMDIDGDGKLEIAVRTAQGFIEILRPQTSDLLWRSSSFPGGARSMVPFDIDADGLEELIVGDGFGTVHIMDSENFDDMTIPAAVIGRIDNPYPVTALDIIDFDGDTRPDIVAYSSANYNITYLRNVDTGSGFQLETNISRQITDLTTIRVEDFNGNGTFEIIGITVDKYANLGGLNKIDTETLEITDYKRNLDIFDYAILDLDGDSFLDIITSTGSAIQVFNGTTLNISWIINGPQFENIYGMTAGDMDNDGRNDIVTIEWNDDTEETTVATINVTSRTYENRSTFPNGVPTCLMGSDIDDDAQVEVVMGNSFGLTVFNVTPNATPNFQIEAFQKAIGYNAFGLGSLDWDDDGIIEIVSGSEQGLVSIIDPFNGRIEGQVDLSPVNMASVAVADLDLDGEDEIVAGNARKATVLYKNLTIRGILNSFDNTSPPPESTEKNALGVADIDGDMIPEVLVGTSDPSIFVFNGTSLTKEFVQYYSYGKIRSMLIKDFDNDGGFEVITGDTMGSLNVHKGSALGNWNRAFLPFGPYGIEAGDVDNDGDSEIIVGSSVGSLFILNSSTLEFENNVSVDLGSNVWGLKLHDIDGDGALELFVGTGDGKLYLLNASTFDVLWVAELGKWIGSYNSLLVEDLDGDGRSELVAGSDGYVYILEILTDAERPNVAVGEMDFTGLPGKDHYEDGEEIEVMVPVTVTGARMNITVDFWLEPEELNVSGPRKFATIWFDEGPGTYDVSVNFTGQYGTWSINVTVDADDMYWESNEMDNRAISTIEVVEAYAKIEWFLGQGTGLGRYSGMALGDDDGDGVPELMVGNLEGFVQSYHLSEDLDAQEISQDLGQASYGLLMNDIDMDGEVEVVVSTGEGWVYSFGDLGRFIEWKTRPADSACYGLDAFDLDNDGVIDILVGCENSWLYILDGRTGEITGSKMLLFELWAVAIGDLLGNGQSVIAVGAQDGTVHLLNGSDLNTEWSFRLGDIAIDDIVIGDIDMDGQNEVVFGDRNGTIYVVGIHGLSGPSDPIKVPVIEYNATLGSAVKGIEIVDIMNEPGPEIVIATQVGVNVLNGTLRPIAETNISGKITGLIAGDIDKDGGIEIVVGTVEGSLHVLTLDNSLGYYTLKITTSLSTVGSGLYGTAMADIDDDMAPEILLGTSSGELRILDGISKEVKAEMSDMGVNLYGIEVADIDDDNRTEVITGSGDERVCAYDGTDMENIWCTGKLGNWSIAISAIDTDGDGDMEVVVGSGNVVRILDGASGTIEHTSIPLGDRILGLAAGNLDNDSRPEIVVGTEDGFIHMLDGKNLTKQWAILLDSWPVGLEIVDLDGDGIGTIFAGTDSKVYEISLMDREIRWEFDLGQSVWGITAGDFDNDDIQEIFIGTRDGKVMAFNGSSMSYEWSSKQLGVRAGWYNSLELSDVDQDGQLELLVGSSGYAYLFGPGSIAPQPIVDAVLESVDIPGEELTHAQIVNVTSNVFNHAILPIRNLTVHILHDGKVMDSTVIDHIGPLERTDVVFQIVVVGGDHNISIVVDRYDVIEEYNEKNNNITVRYYALQEKNLVVMNGDDGIFFSSHPIQDLEVTVFAKVRNSGEERADGTIRFFWGDLNLIGTDTVSVLGEEEVIAAVNWTPTKSGEWDITVVVEPFGVDSDLGDNTGTRKIKVLTHPSVSISSVSVPPSMVEGREYEIGTNISNSGEADSSGIIVFSIDGEEVWRSNRQMLPSGQTNFKFMFEREAGTYFVTILLENISLDTDPWDNSFSLNVTVLSRPDLLFNTVSMPIDDLLKPGRELIIGAVINNRGGVEATAHLKVFDDGQIFFDQKITVEPSNMTTVSVPWTATTGDHELTFRIEDVEPFENVTDNNDAVLNVHIPKKKVVDDGPDWALIAVLVVGILAPFVAVLIYYSQVQPVRSMYANQAIELDEEVPVRRKKRRKKVVKRLRRKKKLKRKEITEEE